MPSPPNAWKQFGGEASHRGVALRWRPNDRGLACGVGVRRFWSDPVHVVGVGVDSAALDAGPVSVDADHFGDTSLARRSGEGAITAPHVQRPLGSRRERATRTWNSPTRVLPPGFLTCRGASPPVA